MIRDYKASWSENCVRYMVNFYNYPDGGCGFDCDENGNVDLDKLNEIARGKYLDAMANPDKFPYAWNEVEKIRGTVRHPATGTCECGKRIELRADYLGACECPKCHRWYNVFGDELKNPRHWNDYGELDYEY